MGLMEESGLFLKGDEKVVKRGGFSGRMPKGIFMWENVSGELVLTNQRVLTFAEKGRLRKKVVYWELSVVGAIVKKHMFRKETLALDLDVGLARPETIELEVDNPHKWREAIVNAATQS